MNYNKVAIVAGGLAAIVGAAVGTHGFSEMRQGQEIYDEAMRSRGYFEALGGLLGAYIGAGAGFFGFINDRYNGSLVNSNQPIKQ
jgi:hypothetical protein